MSSSVRPTTHRHFRSVTSLASLQDRNQRSNQFILINNHNSASRLKISQRNYASLLHRRKPLNIPPGSRGLGWIPTVVRSVLKIRYLLLGGALGGGASLAKVGYRLFFILFVIIENCMLYHKTRFSSFIMGKKLFLYFPFSFILAIWRMEEKPTRYWLGQRFDTGHWHK